MIAPTPNKPKIPQSNNTAAQNLSNADTMMNATAQESNSRVEKYVTTNRFFIEMGGSLVAAFSECSGVSVDIEKEIYQEGGVNDQQRISVGHTRFSDITLKRGLTDDKDFSSWLSELFEQKTKRRNVTIVTFNQAGKRMRSWSLIGAIPVGLNLPCLEADGDMVAVEELTLAFEGLKIGKQSSGGDKVTRDAKGYFGSSKWE